MQHVDEIIATEENCMPQNSKIEYVKQIRRNNLRQMIKSEGNTALAMKLGHANGSYLSQLAGRSATRSISEDVARDIESKLGIPLGSLDRDAAFGSRASVERSQRISEVRAYLDLVSEDQLREIEYVLGLDLI
jgi:hypothetical protein